MFEDEPQPVADVLQAAPAGCDRLRLGLADPHQRQGGQHERGGVNGDGTRRTHDPDQQPGQCWPGERGDRRAELEFGVAFQD